MKSIFNLFRLTSPNSLHSAETILNQLIFNERLSCASEVRWNANACEGKTNLTACESLMGSRALPLCVRQGCVFMCVCVRLR